LSVACIGACGGSQATESDEKPSKKEHKKHREHPPDKEAVSEKGKSWGGWRWKGERDDCYFVHKNKCYDSKSRACEAAACGSASCVVQSGAPSKVSCDK
jgi:hypothetical protein